MSCPWAFVWIIPVFLLGILSILALGALLVLSFGEILRRFGITHEVDHSVPRAQSL
jgi:hypothetical protein